MVLDPRWHIWDLLSRLSTDSYVRHLTCPCHLHPEICVVKHVPTWFPGAGFKRKAFEWRKLSQAMLERPFEMVKQRMASTSVLADCIALIKVMLAGVWDRGPMCCSDRARAIFQFSDQNRRQNDSRHSRDLLCRYSVMPLLAHPKTSLTCEHPQPALTP